jgi:hypothetical protein
MARLVHLDNAFSESPKIFFSYTKEGLEEALEAFTEAVQYMYEEDGGVQGVDTRLYSILLYVVGDDFQECITPEYTVNEDGECVLVPFKKSVGKCTNYTYAHSETHLKVMGL